MELTTATGSTLQIKHEYDPRSTDEQIAIYDWVKNGQGHLVIRARAGSGKTTTLVQISKMLPPVVGKSLFLAFNKHIQEELKLKLPPHVFCYTTHGLGMAAIMRKYKDCQVNAFKADAAIAKYVKVWDLSGVENIVQYFSDMKKLVNLCRLTLTLQKKNVPDLCEKYGIKFQGKDIDRVFIVLEDMLNDKKTIDFVDMVYLPNVDSKLFMFPQEFILVDEAQDLSKAQQEIIRKSVKKVKGLVVGRMIYVGDDQQAIYGFAGSDSFSFANLTKIPNTTVLPLTISFRCAKAIIAEANKLVPDIRAREGAPEGIVRIIKDKEKSTDPADHLCGNVLDEVRSGDFVLSRKTLPLVKLFFELLVKGQKAYIRGSDIGESLIEFTKNVPTKAQLDALLTNKVNAYKEQLRKNGLMKFKEDPGFVDLNDKVGILKFLMSMTDSIEEMKTRIHHIFKGKEEDGVIPDRIVLSTVHKAKGLEAERVFIIMPKDLPLGTPLGWLYQQELNLKYIAITRAKNELVFDFDWKVDDGTFAGFRD